MIFVKCINQECEAYDKTPWVTEESQLEEAVCPLCGTALADDGEVPNSTIPTS